MTEAGMSVLHRSLEESAVVETSVRHACPGQDVEVHGPICTRSSENVRRGLSQAIQSGSGVLRVHLDEADIWDATGLGVLVGAHHRAVRCGRRLVVAGASDRTRRLLTLTKLDRVIPVENCGLRVYARTA